MYEYECYQKEEISKELLLLEGHLVNFTCPHCIDKHSLSVIAYAEETYRITPYVNEKGKLAAIIRAIKEGRSKGFLPNSVWVKRVRQLRKAVMRMTPRKCRLPIGNPHPKTHKEIRSCG